MNNWYVITGAPCSGKTTILKYLEKKGYDIVYEAARIYIDQEIAKGKTLEQIRKDEFFFQNEVLKMKIKIEKKLPKDKIIFFDRGIPDSSAYYKLLGIKTNALLENAIKNCSYKKVLLLDFCEYKKDYARTETKEDQIKLHNLLEESYKEINAPTIKIPIFKTKEERLNFILKILNL